MSRRLIALCVLAAVLAACQSGPTKTARPKGAANFFLPTYLPPGFTIKQGTVQRPGLAGQTFAAVVGREIQPGTFVEIVTVVASDVAADREIARAPGDHLVDIGGVSARIQSDPNRGVALDWATRGVAVVVTAGRGLDGPATEVAKAVRVPEAGGASGVQLAAVAGRSIIDSAAFVSHGPEAGTQVALVGRQGLTITLSSFATAAPLAAVMNGVDELARTTVRGHPALASARTRSQGGAVNSVAWVERPGVILLLSAAAPIAQLLPIAVGLRAVTAAEWQSAVPIRDA